MRSITLSRAEEVRALLRLGAPGRFTCAEVKEIAAHHLQDIRAKIADLVKLERVLGRILLPGLANQQRMKFQDRGIRDDIGSLISPSLSLRSMEPPRISPGRLFGPRLDRLSRRAS